MGACSGHGNGEKGRAKHEEKQHWRRLKENMGEPRRINKVFGVSMGEKDRGREGEHSPQPYVVRSPVPDYEKPHWRSHWQWEDRAA